MPRGSTSKVGDKRVSPNGYEYTKTEEGWILTHKLVAEKRDGVKYNGDVTFRYADGDKTNFDPDNIIVMPKKFKSTASRRARLEARIAELQAELDSLGDDV